MKHQDDTIIDIDSDTLEHSLLDHNNESMNDNIQKVMNKDIQDVYSVISNSKMYRKGCGKYKTTQRKT